MDMLHRDIAGNSFIQWLLASGVFCLAFAAFYLGKKLLCRTLEKISKGTVNVIDDSFLEGVKKTKFFFIFLFSVYLGSMFLDLKPEVFSRIRSLFLVSFFIQVGFWASSIVHFFLNHTFKTRLEQDVSRAPAFSFLVFFGKMGVWILAIALALDNIGVNVRTLVAGLGIGGVAVALACQKILSDLFASISIVLDKPFTQGDFIVVGAMMGTVELIGLKTTRLRSLSGEQLVFPNSDLLESRIKNFKRMYERRVEFNVGVTYQTSMEMMKEIPSMIRQVIEVQKLTRFDRCHFNNYGDFALNFQAVYFVQSSEYNVYMDIHQAINLDVMRRFEEKGVEFAYPTQTLFLNPQNQK